MKIVRVFLAVVLVFVLSAVLPVNIAMAQGNIYVDDDNIAGPWDGTETNPYRHIQDAIDSAVAGDTIYIKNGTYQEWLTVDKQLTIQGEDKYNTILQGLVYSTLKGIDVQYTDGVVISNITLTNFRGGVYLQNSNNARIANCIFEYNDGWLTLDYNGIEMQDSSGCLVADNVFRYNEYGIMLRNTSDGNTIENNTFSHNYYGVRINYSDGNHVTGNNVTENSYGMYVDYGADGNVIEGNDISDSTYQGIYMTICSDNEILNNSTCNNSVNGIFMITSVHRNTVSGNEIRGNGRGIFINTNSSNNTISDNDISENVQEGIYLYQNVTGTEIYNNNIEENDTGIRLFGANGNYVYNNNFIENVVQANEYSSALTAFYLDKPAGGNYWSNWTTPDDDDDGFVDNPYTFGMYGHDDYPWAERDGWTQNQPPEEIELQIDIKPGSDPNSINPSSKGVIRLAVLGTESFDVSLIDVDTVRFGKTGTEAEAENYSYEDVDGDGYIDLVLKFRTLETGIEAGDTEAILTGQTTEGAGISGSDSIRTVPNKGKK